MRPPGGEVSYKIAIQLSVKQFLGTVTIISWLNSIRRMVLARWPISHHLTLSFQCFYPHRYYLKRHPQRPLPPADKKHCICIHTYSIIQAGIQPFTRMDNIRGDKTVFAFILRLSSHVPYLPPIIKNVSWLGVKSGFYIAAFMKQP